MDKKIHFNFAYEGEDVDKLDIENIIEEKIQSQGMDARMTSGSFQCFYTGVNQKPEVIIKKKENNV